MEVFVKDIVDSMTVDVGENLVFDMDLVSLYWECIYPINTIRVL
jgi:hypothetical protein